jgi:hypothetical protein
MNNIPKNQHWTIRLISALAPTLTEKLAQQYRQTSNSGQLTPNRRSHYETKLQSQWRSGGTRGSRDDPIYPVIASGSAAGQPPWPHTAGRNMPADRRRGLDRAPATMGSRSRFYMPNDERLEQGHSVTGQKCDDLHNPSGFAGTVGVSAGAARGVGPTRIPRMHRPGLALMGGPSQSGTRQTWGQGPDSLVIAPVQLQARQQTRGVRSVSGSLSPRSGTGRERIPAIFTPTSVK